MLILRTLRRFPHQRNRLYNAPLLLMPPQRRLIAVLLPFCFLWAFVACVSICEREALASYSPAELSFSTEVNAITDVTDCDGCPLSYFPKATTPQRAQSIPTLDALSTVASIGPSLYSSCSDHISNRVVTPESPPLTLLSKLRI